MSKKYIFIIALLLVAGAIAFSVDRRPQDDNQIACTMDALMCPDGSGVGRSGPDCAFLACPQTESFVGELQQASNGDFQLIVESPDATLQEVTYVLPLEVRVSNVLQDFVGKNVVVYGAFTVGNIYRVETLREAEHSDITTGTVALGETKLINRVRITLNEIPQDSRCPIDAVCVQAGSVTANVTLQSDTDKETLEITEGAPVAFDAYRVAVTSVGPARMASEPFDETAYRVTFSVTPLE